MEAIRYSNRSPPTLKNAFLASFFAAAVAHAAVMRLEVKERSDVLDGKSFGRTGAYERIAGKT